MRSFNVFSNDDGDYRAVKQGWCWPAFFFGSIWALFSGLWLAALLLLPIEFVFSIVGNNANGAFDPYDRYDETTRLVVLAVFSIPLAIRVLLGWFGNSWRAQKLLRLDFSNIGRVQADGKAHAISLCKAAPPDSVRQHAEPVAREAQSVSQFRDATKRETVVSIQNQKVKGEEFNYSMENAMPNWFWPKELNENSALVRSGRIIHWCCYGFSLFLFSITIFRYLKGDLSSVDNEQIYFIFFIIFIVAIAGRLARYLFSSE